MKLISMIASVILLVASVALPSDLTDKLQSASVTVKAGSGWGSAQGSGVLILRAIENTDYTFVLTAGHVIDHLKKTRTETKDGKERKVIEFDDVGIVQEFQQDGRRVGETSVVCRVLRYSDSELGEDLAVLQVRKTNYSKASTEFYLDDKMPDIGTELYHVGSLRGQFGSNSLTSGIISQTGRVFNLAGGAGVIFDQTTATAFPGSSGGGVYRKADGLHLGVLVRGAGEGFNFIVPARRLNAWCEKVGIKWLVDPKAKLPTKDELAKMSVNDTGDIREGGDDHIHYSQDSLRFPTLIRHDRIILPPDAEIVPAPADFDDVAPLPPPAP